MKEKLLNFIDKHFNFINIILYGSIFLEFFLTVTFVALKRFDIPIPSKVMAISSIVVLTVSLISMMLIFLYYEVFLFMTLYMIVCFAFCSFVIFFTEIAAVCFSVLAAIAVIILIIKIILDLK